MAKKKKKNPPLGAIKTELHSILDFGVETPEDCEGVIERMETVVRWRWADSGRRSVEVSQSGSYHEQQEDWIRALNEYARSLND